jgi:hypothetical protein
MPCSASIERKPAHETVLLLPNRMEVILRLKVLLSVMAEPAVNAN